MNITFLAAFNNSLVCFFGDYKVLSCNRNQGLKNPNKPLLITLNLFISHLRH